MKRKHLSTKELLAIYQGDTEDFAALEHLASCARCQKSFDDSGWVRLLRQLPRLVEAGPHLDPNELGAYRHSAVSAPRVAQIERHLRSCSRCLALYQRSRTEEQTLDYLSPRPELIRKARRAFRPGKVRWLGTVLLTGLGQGPRAILLPERRVASGDELFAGEAPSSARNHPSSARQRAMRLREKPACLARLDDTDSTSFPVDAEAGSSAAQEPLRVETGDWDILIHAPSGDDPGRLGLQLVSVAQRRPMTGIRVIVEGRKGDRPAEVATDEEGRAAVFVSPGRSRIVVDVDPPLALSFTLLD